MKHFACLLSFLATAGIAHGQLVAVEHFLVSNTSGLGYKANLNMASGSAQGNVQNPPPAETGFARWLVQNVWQRNEVTAGNLAFSNLASQGGRFQSNAGGTNAYVVVDTGATSPFAEYIAAGNDQVGSVDGRQLYLSFLFRLTGTPTGNRQNTLALGYATPDFSPVTDALTGNFTSRLEMGHRWNSSTLSVGSLSIAPIDTDTHLFVVKFEYKAGVDTATIWLDPNLSLNEAGSTPAGTRTGDYKFNALQIRSMGLAKVDPNWDFFNLDEIRWAKTWEDVLPLAATYSLTVPVDGNGSVTLNPPGDSYLDGTPVTLTAVAGGADDRFRAWSGDAVPAGQEKTNPLTLTMTANLSLTAHFEPIPSHAFTVVVDPAEGGQVLASETSPVRDGTVVTFEALPEAGFELSHWTVGGNSFSTPQLERAITAETTVTAHFRSTALAVDPPAQLAPAAGGGFEATVTTATSWTATKSASWIALTQGGGTQTGSGLVKYTVLPNSTEAVRSATITIGTQTLTVTQFGRSLLTQASFTLGGDWKWNPLGYFYDRYAPYLWWHDQAAWLYVFPGGSENGGYYLYDFRRLQWGWVSAGQYASGIIYF